MKIYFYRRDNGLTNFGDELNPWTWEKLLPGVIDDDDSTLFLGIGTLLNNRIPKARRTIIFGTGVGYGPPPTLDETWNVYCVRGPLSVKALNLDPSLALTDPGILVRRLYTDTGRKKMFRYSFMPHWHNATAEIERVCLDIGFGYIDPGWPVERVLDAIMETETLLAEAMHGTIAADALRVPWISVTDKRRKYMSTIDFKWQDFCLSVGVDYEPHPLPHIWKLEEKGIISRLRRSAKLKLFGHELKRVARTARPILSKASRLEDLTCELESKLDQFKRDHATGCFA